jgi:hypothetical protein
MVKITYMLLQAVSQYYMVKMSIRSERVCKRPWNFERVPNKMLQGHDKALIFTSTKEACLAACLNEVWRLNGSLTGFCQLQDFFHESVSPEYTIETILSFLRNFAEIL